MGTHLFGSPCIFTKPLLHDLKKDIPYTDGIYTLLFC